jgi:hypothetical protein
LWLVSIATGSGETAMPASGKSVSGRLAAALSVG